MRKQGLSIHLLWLGIVVVAAGITLSFLGADYAFWSVLGMLGGIVLILLYILFNFSEVQEFVLAYSTRQWATMALFVVLLVAVMIVVQMIANNHNYRFDLTSEGKMSVTPLTKKLLQGVKSPVNVIGFYREEERDALHALVEQYRLASPKFSYELYNLDRNPGLARKYGVSAYGTAVVETNGKSKQVKYPSEEAIINAVLSLTNPSPAVVYFLTGHGEPTLEGLEQDTDSYGLVKKALETENIIVRSLLFIGGKPVPSDADIVVCGGPSRDFTEEEVAALEQYVRGGGGLILAIDPGDQEELLSFLGRCGVGLDSTVVVDPEDYLIEKSPLVPLVPYYFSHPITDGFTTPAVFAVARPVGKANVVPDGVTVTSLARSGEKSWADADAESAEKGKYEYDPQFDHKGPVTVAAVSEVRVASAGNKSNGEETKPEQVRRTGDRPRTGKIVVFGDSDFLRNWYFDLLGNKDLFLNTTHWMAEDELLISIRKKEPSKEDLAPVYLSPMHSRLIFIGIVILQPVFVLTGGVVVAWRRRRKG